SRRQAGRRTARLVSTPPRHLQATPHHRVPSRPPPSGERQTRPPPPPGPPLGRSAAPHLAPAEAGVRLGRKGASGVVAASGAGGQPVECLEDLQGAPQPPRHRRKRRPRPTRGPARAGVLPSPRRPPRRGHRPQVLANEQQVLGAGKGLSRPSWSTRGRLRNRSRTTESAQDQHFYSRRRAELNRCTGFCRPLPEPLGHAAVNDREPYRRAASTAASSLGREAGPVNLATIRPWPSTT